MVRKIKKLIEYTKIILNLALDYFKTYRVAFLISFTINLFDAVITIATVYLFTKNTGILKELTLFDLILIYFISEIIRASSGMLSWKASYSNWMDYGKLTITLIRPFPNIIGRIVVDFHGYWFSALLINSTILLILLIYGAIKGYISLNLANLLLALISFIITIIFYISIDWLILSFDFLKKGITPTVWSQLNELENNSYYFPPNYFSKKLITTILFSLSSYFLAYFTVYKSLKGQFNIHFHITILILSIILFILANKIIEKGLKKYEAYL